MHPSTYPGHFIVFEGGEGSGKDTQIDLLRERLPADTVYTNEPGGTPIAEDIRSLLLDSKKNISEKTELALFCASRGDHVEQVIGPALEAGKIVVCNRFDLSTFAYQMHGRRQLEHRDFLQQMNDYVVGAYQPSVYIYLNVSPEEGLRRVNKRADENTRFDNEKIAFHKRVRDGYRKACEEFENCLEIDGERSIEAVAEDVQEVIDNILST